MEVAVQWIRTSWTKRSRGGEAATRRNATPTAFPLPALPRPFTHEVTLDENDDFHPRFTTHEGLRDAGVRITEADKHLRVLLVASRSGAPVRNRRPPACRLAPGEWLRWQINYRYSGYHGWSYRQDTLNVAYGPAPADLFLGAPTHHVDELASLF